MDRKRAAICVGRQSLIRSEPQRPNADKVQIARLREIWGASQNVYPVDHGAASLPKSITVAAATVAVVVGGLMIATRTDDPTEEVPADQPTTVAPTTTVAPHRETGAFEGGPSVTYIVPEGWTGGGNAVIKEENHPGEAFIGMNLMSAEENFYTIPCVTTSEGIEYAPVGPTVDDLVSAWANLPGVDATAARDVTIDGFDGKQIEFATYHLEGCNMLHYDCSFDGSEEPNRPTRCYSATGGGPLAVPGVHEKVWVLDVDGTRLMINAGADLYGSSQHDRAVLDEIVASIEFG